jgi:hypothetical protein
MKFMRVVMFFTELTLSPICVTACLISPFPLVQKAVVVLVLTNNHIVVLVVQAVFIGMMDHRASGQVFPQNLLRKKYVFRNIAAFFSWVIRAINKMISPDNLAPTFPS